MRNELEAVRAWASDRLATGDEPPWAWYQYMKLREALDAIIAGMDATTTENLPQSASRSERRLRLVATTHSRDGAPPHQLETQIQLPM